VNSGHIQWRTWRIVGVVHLGVRDPLCWQADHVCFTVQQTAGWWVLSASGNMAAVMARPTSGASLHQASRSL
jgi:hypothetical protein